MKQTTGSKRQRQAKEGARVKLTAQAINEYEDSYDGGFLGKAVLTAVKKYVKTGREGTITRIGQHGIWVDFKSRNDELRFNRNAIAVIG